MSQVTANMLPRCTHPVLCPWHCPFSSASRCLSCNCREQWSGSLPRYIPSDGSEAVLPSGVPGFGSQLRSCLQLFASVHLGRQQVRARVTGLCHPCGRETQSAVGSRLGPGPAPASGHLKSESAGERYLFAFCPSQIKKRKNFKDA